MSGLLIILLLLLYWLLGQILRRANYVAMYDRMGNSEILWYYLLACGLILMWF